MGGSLVGMDGCARAGPDAGEPVAIPTPRD